MTPQKWSKHSTTAHLKQKQLLHEYACIFARTEAGDTVAEGITRLSVFDVCKVKVDFQAETRESVDCGDRVADRVNGGNSTR